MASTVTSWILQLVDKISSPLKTVEGTTNNVVNSMEDATKKTAAFGDCLKRLKPIDWQGVRMGVNALSGMFDGAAEIGRNYEDKLLEVSAITGTTGKDLDDLGSKARGLAKQFGESAADNLGIFQSILGKLGPQIGESSEAMGNMGKYVNVLAKTMGGDTAGAVNALTTSMLQFGVDLNNPITAAAEMERMMNIMAAGAQEGASEVTDIAASLEQAGGMARIANVSFGETTAALEALARGGKLGAEAGVGLRNVLIKMNAPSKVTKEASEILARYGVNMKKVANTSIPLTERLRELSKIGGNSDALAALFGGENVQSAQTLLEQIDFIEELKGKITDTNSAYQQSETIMSSWTEWLKRAKNWIDDLKIGTLDLTNVLSIGFGIVGGGLATLADFSTIYSGLTPVIKSAGIAIKGWSLWTGIATVASKIWAVANTAVSISMLGITLPIWAVVAGIAALVAGFVLLWNKCEGFRAVMTGLWEVIKGFGNLIKDFIIDRIKGLLSGIGALGQAIAKLFKGDFSGAWESAKEGVSGIIGVDAVKNAYENAKGLGSAFSQGYEDGKANFQAAKAEKEEGKSAGGNTKMPSPSIGAKSISGNPPKVNPLNSGSGGTGSEKNTISGTGGSGSGKHITMNVTMNINNHGVKNPEEFTEQVVRKINDKLNDALAAA